MNKTFESRSYQNRIHTKAIEYLSKPNSKGIAKTAMIESPTGSGKTVMGMRLAKHLEAQGHKVGWIAHRKELLEQAKQCNQDFFKIKNIKFISLFTRQPEQFKDRTAMVVDECLPGDVDLKITHNNEIINTTLKEVINGKGTHVLSMGKNGLEFNKILNRTPMGKKEIYEVIIETQDGCFVLPITEEGRIFADGKYRKVKNLSPGQSIVQITSCWQKYAETAQCNESRQTTLFKNSRRKSKFSSSMQMWMWPKSEMVLIYQKVQDLSIQPQSAAACKNDYSKTGANYQRDNLGRRKFKFSKKQKNQSIYRKSKIKNQTWPSTAAIYTMAPKRIRFDHITKNCNFEKPWFRENDLCFFDSITPQTIRGRENNLLPQEDSNLRILRKTRGSRTCRLVDGRRSLRRDALNTFIFDRRTPNNYRMVQSAIQNCSNNRTRQEEKASIFINKAAIFEHSKGDSETIYDSIDGIQSGIIKEVRKTGRHTETYDIGVDKVHNFFADGILVHNCQHDAAKSASVLHDVIRPSIILGLTATPYRADRAQLCFQKVIRDAGIHQLIREGFLAEYNSFIYDREWTPNNIANLFMKDQAKWGKSVIYFLTKDDAKACAKIMLSEGIKAGYVVGDEPREETLQAFRNDELDVLTNVAVLTEGFDEPSLKTAFVRPSSKGPTVQMAGRAFRKCPGIPICNIVQNKDTKYPFTKHATAYGQYIMREGEWRSINPKNLKPFFEKQRKKIAQVVIDMPKFLKNRDKERFSSFDE